MSEKAERFAELQAERAGALVQRLDELLPLKGDERVLDVGTGTGAFAFALAPRVREVIAVDSDEAMVERARRDAPPNVAIVHGDGEHLPFDDYSFDLVICARTLHHVPRPELVIAELTRVTRPRGSLLVVDQIAPVDPLAAFELNRFEHAREPSTTRVLSDADLRGLFDANGLVLKLERIAHEPRDLDRYLDLAGCEGADRERVLALAPEGYEQVIGWYLLTR